MATDDTIVWENVDDLLFDPENPRLPEELQGGRQSALLKYIAKHEAVDDLMGAIGRNGFFAGEPLVVYRNSDDPRGKYRVIEGNRRLASVKILRDPSLFSERPSLREIAEESPKRNKPERLPVIKVAKRSDALPYLGSRHIVGVKSWDPLPKARYMKQLFDTTSESRAASQRYRDVARQIGSGKRTDYIRKNLNALAVYDVIAEADFFGDDSANEQDFKFGVLYTALDSKPIAAYIGMCKYNALSDEVIQQYEPIVTPAVLKKPKIRELYDWIHRKNERTGKTTLGESRDIPRLAAVLRSTTATQTLKKTGDLDIAYEGSDGAVTEVSEALSRVLSELRYANSLAANASTDALVLDLAVKVMEQAEQLVDSLKARAKKRSSRNA